jgi:hypothetical protein
VDGLPWWSFVFFLPLLVLMAIHIWAVIDGIRIPSRWREVGRPKVIWLLLIWFTSPIGPLYYLLRLRPRLRG